VFLRAPLGPARRPPDRRGQAHLQPRQQFHRRFTHIRMEDDLTLRAGRNSQHAAKTHCSRQTFSRATSSRNRRRLCLAHYIYWRIVKIFSGKPKKGPLYCRAQPGPKAKGRPGRRNNSRSPPLRVFANSGRIMVRVGLCKPCRNATVHTATTIVCGIDAFN